MATAWSGEPLMEIGAEALAERVRQLSNGRIDIEVFPGGALGPALRVSEMVQQVVADMGHIWVGYDCGAEPTAALCGGYAGSFDTEKMHWLYRGDGVELQEESRRETMGLVSMPLVIRTAQVFLHSRVPVRTLEEMQGVRGRTAGAWIEMAQSMGAAPVTTRGGDIQPALERGVIDAVEWGTLWENISTGFHEVAPHVVIPGVHHPAAPFELVINETAWNSLSAEDQELVRIAARLTMLDSWLTIGQEDAKALDFFREAGKEIVDLAPEFQYKARAVGHAWAGGVAEENPWFARILESQAAFEELWSGAGRYRNVQVRADRAGAPDAVPFPDPSGP
jgi:TRAP-type mannitol/chloroaromatic compound transport system substrate-binding protein